MTRHIDEVPKWESIVDPSLVYKQSDNEICVTKIGSSTNYLASQGIIPINHSHFGDVPRSHADVGCYCEFMIQSIEAIARTKLDADANTVFVLRDIKIDIMPDMRKIKRIHSGHTASIYFNRRQVRTDTNGRAYAIDGPARCYINDIHAADLHGTVAMFNPDTYATARGTPKAFHPHRKQRLPRPAPPEVGRTQSDNVLIEGVSITSKTATGWLVSTQHPSYFDRPLDHYPGMMMAEASRQLAVMLAHHCWEVSARELCTFRSELHFRMFAELDSPPRIAAIINNAAENEIDIHILVDQDEQIIMNSCFVLGL